MSVILPALCVVLMATVSITEQTLQCFQCSIGFWDMCVTTKTNCSVGDQCFVGTGKAASVLDIKMMGCLPEERCNKTTTAEFPANKTIYTMTMRCCNENYCNGGPAVLLPSFTILALAIAQTMGVF